MTQINPTDGVAAPRIAGSVDNRTSILRSFLILIIPGLAILGGLAPGFGPLFAFRLAALTYILVAFFSPLQRERAPSTFLSWATIGCFLWLGSLGLLLLFRGTNDAGSAEVLSVLIGVLLILAVLRGPFTRQMLMLWAYGWLLAYVAAAAVAVWELATGRHLPNFYVYVLDIRYWNQENVVAATLGNPNNYAFFLVVSALVCAFGRHSANGRASRISFTAGLVTAPILVFFTQSRLALALVLTVTLFAVAMRRPVWLFLAGPLGVGALIVTVENPQWILQVFGLRGSTISDALGADVSGEVRVNLFLNGMDFATRGAFLGLGPGSFEQMMLSGSPRFWTAGIINPHNLLIEVLLQYGAVVFVPLLIALTRAAVVAAGCSFNEELDRFDRTLARSVLLIVISLPVLGLMSSTTLNMSFPWVCFAFVALSAAYLEIGIVEKSERRSA
ncbi:O-antigen ligase family protein [Sediminivirga luteola]|uniref:O-antigen ligase family protein n=1 Tax=Sediminivirga luteola TaxID=1774748 RepID=UPI001F5851F1|nr:O-antigen ligase family protein [Sediminivirga luteola]MCI2266957.1 O-antigen ligase family protein [Sediminivirga luteola]